MYQLVFLLVFPVILCDGFQQRQPVILRANTGNLVHGYGDATRQKRSVPTEIGKAAVAFLLKGSLESKSEFANFKNYLKLGNWETAYKDWRSLNPTDVTTTKFSNNGIRLTGKIGDHTVSLVSRGRIGKKIPALTITDPKSGDLPKRFYYRKKYDRSNYYR